MILPAASNWWDGIVKNAQDPWQLVLLLGQMIFFSRFLVQWIATEKKKQVVMPVAFWWLSIGGAGISLVALVAKREPVLIVAQVTGLLLYGRNLVIHSRHVRTLGTPAA